MSPAISYPEINSENRKKLFSQLDWYCHQYDKSLEAGTEKEAWRHQAYGMVVLYISLFPEEEVEISDFWVSELLNYLSR